MVKTTSGPAAIGTTMPTFELPDFHGRVHNSRSATGRNGTLVMFLCNHCPYVKHIAPALSRITDELNRAGVAAVAINSNDPTDYPEDSPEGMAAVAAEHNYRFPYLIDTEQTVARAFGAVCTPDFFLFDHGKRLFYRGQIDSSRPKNWLVVSGVDLRAAVSAMLSGQPAPTDQIPSLGCSIKWRDTEDRP